MTQQGTQYETKAALFIELFFNETLLATGTAFVVDRDDRLLLLTARHNLTGRHHDTGKPLSDHGGLPNWVVVWQHTDAAEGGWTAVSYALYDLENQAKWLEHPVLGPAADLAALPFTKHAELALLPLKIDDAQPALATAVTSEVYVVGYPVGYNVRLNAPLAVWTRGSLATEPSLAVDGLPVTLVDARTRGGQSGSPVLRQERGVVQYDNGGSAVGTGGPVRQMFGLYTGRVRADADIGRVWWLSALRDLADGGVCGSGWGEPPSAPPVLRDLRVGPT